MIKKSKLESLADVLLNEGPGAIIIIITFILLFSLVGLAIFDPVVGAKSGAELTGNTAAGWLLSLATTAIIMVPFAVVTYIVTNKKLSPWGWIGVILILSVGLVGSTIDIIFDGWALDVWKYQKFIDIQTEIPDPATRNAHNLGRWLFRLLSVVGDAGAGMLIGVFPLLKQLLGIMLGNGNLVKPNTANPPTPIKQAFKPFVANDQDGAPQGFTIMVIDESGNKKPVPTSTVTLQASSTDEPPWR